MATVQQQERYVFLDWAKAIGISLICVGHFCEAGSPLRVLLYSFHVPLFFVVSGLLFHVPLDRQHLKKRAACLVQRIGWPYIVWFAISTIPARLVYRQGFMEIVSKFFFLDGTTIWNSALWFLPCFGIVSIVMLLIGYAIRDKSCEYIYISIGSFVATIVIDQAGVRECFWGLNKCVLLLGYYALGCSMKRLMHRMKMQYSTAKGQHRLLLAALTVFTISTLAACYVNRGDNISIMQLDYNNILFFIPTAGLLTVSFLVICMALPRSNIVERLSRNTIFMMCTHLFVRPLAQLVPFEMSVWIGIMLVAAYIILLALIPQKIYRYHQQNSLLTKVGMNV